MLRFCKELRQFRLFSEGITRRVHAAAWYWDAFVHRASNSSGPDDQVCLHRLRATYRENQGVGRAIVLQIALGGGLKLGNDPCRQDLAEFDAPLVEGVDVPDARPA